MTAYDDLITVLDAHPGRQKIDVSYEVQFSEEGHNPEAAICVDMEFLGQHCVIVPFLHVDLGFVVEMTMFNEDGEETMSFCGEAKPSP